MSTDSCCKFFVGMLAEAASTDARVYKYRKINFQRVWLQGVLTGGEGGWYLDDGTDCIKLNMSKLKSTFPHVRGMYIMVIGRLGVEKGESCVGVQKLVDLSSDPNRESLWFLEVIDVCNRFYNEQV